MILGRQRKLDQILISQMRGTKNNALSEGNRNKSSPMVFSLRKTQALSLKRRSTRRASFPAKSRERKEERTMKKNPEKNTKNETTKLLANAICYNHQGKMEGMLSLSTSPLQNPYCVARRNIKGSICEKCFSFALNGMKGREKFKEKLLRNTVLLCETLYPVDVWPLLNVRFFRLESFGDLQNTIQVKNYFNLCRRNPHATFALWTKNPLIIRRALLEGAKKPRNLIIIFSSCMINRAVDIDVVKRVFPFVDKIFTVYDKEHAKDANINCGANHCLSCLRCYKKNSENVINEKLK